MKTFKKAPIAIAIASLFISGSALAFGGGGWPGGPGNGGGNDESQQTGFEASSSITSTATNEKSISVNHETDFSSDVDVNGNVYLRGKGYAGALTDSKQMNDDNTVNNNQTENSGDISGGAFQGASGNIGANVAGGDNNQQANDAALAVSDANQVFARATNASFQSSAENTVNNASSSNSAGLSNGAFQNVIGNIGVNAAAGAGNSQQNAFSAAVGDGGSAEATSAAVQQSYNNVTNNGLAEVTVTRGRGHGKNISAVTNSAYIGSGSFQGATGNISANVASGSGNMQRNSMTIAASR